MEPMISTSRFYYWGEGLKQHWIIWTSVSTLIAILSFLKLDVTNPIPSWIFWIVTFMSFAYVVLSQLTLSIILNDVKKQISLRKFDPSFNKVRLIEALDDGNECFRVIAEATSNLNIQVNTLVAAYEKGVAEKSIGLGRVSRINSDDTLELIITPSWKYKVNWADSVRNDNPLKDNIVFSTLIPKELIPNIDDYIGQENTAVSLLQKTVTRTPDGAAL